MTNFYVIKSTRCTNFTNLFCHETLHVSDNSSVHHQEFIHCTLSNGICHTAFEQGPGWICSSILALLESCMTDELSKTCWVSWQNKFVKLVHLVGFITKKKYSFCMVRNIEETVSILKTKWLMRCGHIISAYCKNLTKHIHVPCIEYVGLLSKLFINQRMHKWLS